MATAPLSVAVLISGRGSNLEALARSAANQQLNIQIQAVISNQPAAPGIRHARQYGLKTHIIDHRSYVDKTAFEHDLIRAIDAAKVELIILAGFMRVLSSDFVQQYAGQIINLHPSLLPKYPGLDTHHRVLEAGDVEHGASVHLVEPELDSGPVIAQYRMPVNANDTAETLAQRLAPHEHRLLQAVTALFAVGAIQVESGQIYFENQPLRAPLILGQGLNLTFNKQS